MLGSVYAHIFGAANARRDVYELSRRVYEHEDPEFDVDEWVAGAHPLDDHALEHPLVTELVGQDEAGPSAALAYMEDMDEDDAGAVIRWMMAGAFKGLFETDAEFCEDRFASAIADHMELWGNSAGSRSVWTGLRPSTGSTSQAMPSASPSSGSIRSRPTRACTSSTSRSASGSTGSEPWVKQLSSR